jgi:hypothetical protein
VATDARRAPALPEQVIPIQLKSIRSERMTEIEARHLRVGRQRTNRRVALRRDLPCLGKHHTPLGRTSVSLRFPRRLMLDAGGETGG